MRVYFGGTFDEENIRCNFVLIYELFDEIMDFGYPQVTALEVLTSFIETAQGTETKKNGESIAQKDPSMITGAVTGNCDWRQAGKYRYKNNEVFIDVAEAVNLLMSSKGSVLKADVSGKVIMRAYLSGMPECKLGMNDKVVIDRMEAQRHRRNMQRRVPNSVAIDDVTFHRSVKLSQYDHDRSINFIPPDGEFQLMKYRITSNINLPFRVIPVVSEHGRSRVEYEIKVKGNFDSEKYAENVILKIPVPKNAAKWKINTGPGKSKAKYNPGLNAILWKIKKFYGDASYILRAEVRLASSIEEKPWARPPITMEFMVDMFASSGLGVTYLKIIERANYKTVKWVRYQTRAGHYQIRI